jgi:hypothetical protein
MFRKGGSAEGGITSGLQSPRQGYNTNENNIVKQNDLSKLDVRNMNPQQMKDFADSYYPKKPRPNYAKRRIGDAMIDFGIDIASRPPMGSGIGGAISTALASAKEPFANYRAARSIDELAGSKADDKLIDQRGDMFETLLGAQAKIQGSEGGSGMFAKGQNDLAIQDLMGQLFELTAAQNTDQKLSDEDFNKQQSILMQRLQAYTGKNPAVTSLFGNKDQATLVIEGIQQDILNSKEKITIINAQREEEIVIEGEYASANPKYIGEETAKRYIEMYNQMIRDSMGLADGGRAGYASGDLVEEQVTEISESKTPEFPIGPGPESRTPEFPIAPTSDSLSYEELRARLPQEISDDIVSILAESPQALIMFSEIQTQTDVDEFNMTYGVNLSLPSGA